MRDILPFYFIRERRDVVFVDPKGETGLFWEENIKRENERSHDHQLPSSGLVTQAGNTKSRYPIQDEAHNLYNPETEKILNKLRRIGQQ